VEVTGITEMVGNALVFPEEIERTTDLRDRDLVGMEDHGGVAAAEETEEAE
jgi:hypothetical protein